MVNHFLVTAFESYRDQISRDFGISVLALTDMVSDFRDPSASPNGQYPMYAGTMNIEAVVKDYALAYSAGKVSPELLAHSMSALVIKSVFGSTAFVAIRDMTNTIVVELTWPALLILDGKALSGFNRRTYKGQEISFIAVGALLK